ncbi:MAG: hypothetical protein ACU837_14245 [Gammaproteobacteria bacterium]
MIQKAFLDGEAPPIRILRFGIGRLVADNDPGFFRAFFPTDRDMDRP